MRSVIKYVLLLVVMALTACHDDNYNNGVGGNGGREAFINFSTRAGGNWDDVLLPGQKFRAVIVNGQMKLVPASIGIYGFLMNDDYTRVLDVDKQEFEPVFYNDVLTEYDRPQNGEGGNNSGEITEVSKEEMVRFQKEEWENLEKEEFGDIKDPTTGERTNLMPVDNSDGKYDGSITQPNGVITDSTGTRPIYTPEHTDDPDNPDGPEIIDITNPPYGISIAEDGTVEFRDGTKITADYVYKKFLYVKAGTSSADSYEVPVMFQIFRNGGEDRYKILYDGQVTEGTTYPNLPSADELGIEEITDNDGKITITFPDGTVVTREKDLTQQGVSADGSPITTTHTTTIVFPMKWSDETQNEHDITVTLDCIAKTLTFLEGNSRKILDLSTIQKKDDQTSGDPITGGDGTQTNPSRKRIGTRATDIPFYDDDYDKYYWGYNAHKWTSGHYMFYAYSPCSEHVDFDYNKDGADPKREKGAIGNFTWGKIPSISNTDYIVAKSEVWKYNDPTRVHFDAMDHLMSRIRVAFAIHPDYHKIRRVVITNVSLTILEPGFNRIYEYSNSRTTELDGKSGVMREGNDWTIYKENGKDYLYNPAKNPAAYAENIQEKPFDAVHYEDGGSKYGKLLYPLKADGEWKRENLFNDFYIVPFLGNKASAMTVCVEYDVYDTDVCDADGNPIAGEFPSKHRIRRVKRVSTLKFKDKNGDPTSIEFKKNQSRTLNVLINPDYIFTLFDHDEPATLVVE